MLLALTEKISFFSTTLGKILGAPTLNMAVAGCLLENTRFSSTQNGVETLRTAP